MVSVWLHRDSEEDFYCLVKGSPEAVGALLEPGQAPSWYSQCYEQLARKGLRVLALAFKTGQGTSPIISYHSIEQFKLHRNLLIIDCQCVMHCSVWC